MKWFLIVYITNGGLGLSVTEMPSEAMCMKVAEQVIDTISTTRGTAAITRCVGVRP